jgi:hypothetical protein
MCIAVHTQFVPPQYDLFHSRTVALIPTLEARELIKSHFLVRKIGEHPAI